MIKAKAGVLAKAPVERGKLEIRSLLDLLRSLVGKIVTVSHPESMKNTPENIPLSPARTPASTRPRSSMCSEAWSPSFPSLEMGNGLRRRYR